MAIRLTDYRRWLFGLGIVALGLGLCVTIVPEDSQAVVLRMGEPIRVVNRYRPNAAPGGGGLLAHLPVVESVTWIDRGLQNFETERQPVRTSDNRMIEIETVATYRVFDPVKLVNTAGTGGKAVEQLKSVLNALMQQEFGRVDASTLLRPGSGGGAERLRRAIDAKARSYGVQVIDLRVVSGALAAGGQQELLDQMQAAREGMADELAQQGARDAMAITARAQADSARLLADAAGQDPEFYDFYRAMRSYDSLFADPKRKGAATIIISPDNAYLRQFNGK